MSDDTLYIHPDSVTHFEVIDHRAQSLQRGRRVTIHGCRIELSYQDDGRTLKVFVTDRGENA